MTVPQPAVTPASEPATSPAEPSLETWAVCAVLAIFVVVGFNHIHSNTIYGQDFLLHSSGTENLIAHPDEWFPQDFTNRPLVYWIGAGCHWITHGKAPWEMAGAVFVLLNTAALFFLHDSTRRFIRSPWLRIAALMFTAFLPATQIATIVYAADAVCQLPFTLTLWSLLRSAEAESGRSRIGFALLAGFALSLGAFARFTFIAVLPAVAIVIALLWRSRRVNLRHCLLVASAALLGPVLVAGWIEHRASLRFSHRDAHHTFNWRGTGEMTWSSLLLLKSADVRVLDAPGYWDHEMIGGQPRLGLLVNNRYSYPALLHLSIFTDVLDYANEGQIDDGAPRPEPQKTIARWCVRLGLVFSVAGFFSIGWFSFRCVRALWQPAAAPSTGSLLWGILALAWFLPLALALPFVYNSYDWGYWLSRLIIPALWGFSVVLFAMIDETCARFPRAIQAITALVAIQAFLHVRSLWY
ncbi:MAG: hypothetical protein JWM35_334 [Verrucomicrobia bacterium]|nr:hypothetical protein [Verrucomicrobiota bacterium]